MSAEIEMLNQEITQAQGPAPRDRDIFAAVAYDRTSQRQVAQEFGVSQARVSQIVGGVGEWMTRVLPEMESNLTGPEKLRLATRLCRQELQRLRLRGEEGWEASLRDKVLNKERHFRQEVWKETAVTNQAGKIGYISCLHRIIISLAKLDGVDVSGLSIRQELLAEGENRPPQPAGEVAAPEVASAEVASEVPPPEAPEELDEEQVQLTCAELLEVKENCKRKLMAGFLRDHPEERGMSPEEQDEVAEQVFMRQFGEEFQQDWDAALAREQAGSEKGAEPALDAAHHDILSLVTEPAGNLDKEKGEPENPLSPAVRSLIGKLGNSWDQPENRLSPLHRPENRLSPSQRRKRFLAQLQAS